MTNPPRVVAIIALFLFARAAFAQIDAVQFQRDLEELSRHPSRSICSPGYYAATEYIEKQIGALPNVELRRHEFPMIVPVTESATIGLGAGRIEKVYPFWPAHLRACTTPPNGITGNLVYAGECRYADLRPASLYKQIAVVEASARDRWMDAFNMGADAMIVLGRADTSWSDLSSHDLRIPVNLPRFYVPPGALADELRRAKGARATLKSTVTWQRKMARNYYALVRSEKPATALMFSVPLESSSVVPDLSPGASQAIQAACGLALVRDLSKQPWSRPVLIAFTGGDSIQMSATRNMLLALAEPPVIWRDEFPELDAKIARTRRDLDRAKNLAGEPHRLLIPADRALIDRTVKVVETDLTLTLDQLFRMRATPAAERTAEQREQLAAMEARQSTLNRLKYGFAQNPSSLSSPSLASAARDYIARTIATLGGSESADGLLKQQLARKAELNARIELYHWLAAATGRTNEPEEKQTDARLIELLIGLDLSDRSLTCGPMFFGGYQRSSGMPQIQDYREWFTRAQRERRIPATIDVDPLIKQSRAPSTYLAGPLPLASELAPAWGVPGVSMITLNDLRLRRDTPADTLDKIDAKAILPQLQGVRDLFAAASSDPKFHGPVDLKRLRVSLTGQVVGASPGRPVPDLPRPGFFATYSYVTTTPTRTPQLGDLPWTMGVRRTEVHDCDADGNYLFEGLPRLRGERLEGVEKLQADMQVLAVQVYRIDPKSGAIVSATDLGKQAGDIQWWVDIRKEFRPLRSLAFDCEEFTLTRLYDPRFLQSLSEVVPLDARRNSDPQRFYMMSANQMLAGFIEPQLPAALLVRYGRVGNRLVLLNEDGKGFARGYTPQQLSDLGPLALETARDFHRLDAGRLDDYRRAGVSAKLLDTLHAEASDQIAAAEASLKSDDGVGLVRNATGAWANEARVYSAAQAMARDVVRAAIFLLLLCVPFSFCMERLLIGTPNVYRQIAGAAAIFAVMTIALISFHPAFKISTSPLIIVLAFAIILMSCIVIIVLYGKFDAELKRLRSGRGAGAVAATFASTGVLMSAVMLGLANMRRRKFRTVLTSLTIVLITFAVLCFTSTTRYVGTSSSPTGVASSHAGLLLRQRGFRPISPILPDQLRAVLADPKLKLSAPPTVVERWWAISTSEPNEQYNLTAISPSPGKPGEGRGEGLPVAARTISIPAVLGLSPGESKLSRIAETIGPEKFARLEKGERDVIYISKSTADQLNTRENDTIRLAGMDLHVAGIYDDRAFDDNVKMLSGESLAPLKFTAGQVDAGGRKLDDTAAESMELGGAGGAGAGESDATYEFLPSSEFVILPADTARRLHKCMLRSVALNLDTDEQVAAVADELSRRFALALFAGDAPSNDGGGTVRMIAASNLSAMQGAGQIAVPLLVAGLIIFNTMMGSIAERKREIHVYTSLGLAPAHVGALFLAEALTYGLIGTVFGYVIGQGFGTLLLKLGLLGGVTLDYSGSSAIMSMGLILLIVLISAIVPARLASKLAAPSIDRSWKVPPPIDGTITASLPFTINQTAADGVLAYLADFLADHREGAIGKFAAGRVEPLAASANGARGLRTSIWLTPYDLGVRQHLTLLIHAGDSADIYEVKVLLRRLSGDDTNFHRMNRTFLTELRKQFLQWRSLPPAKMMEYVQRSKILLTSNPAAVSL